MATVNEIAAFVEEFAPSELAEEWDNVGTLINCGGTVTSVLTSLDITKQVMLEAEQRGCQLVVAHHPVIFNPLRNLSHHDVVFRMVRKNISAICAHTNLDAALGGVNDILAAIFNLAEPEPFAHMGRIGTLREPVTATELAASCESRFSAHVRFADAGNPIRRLAVVGGSGGSLVEEAVAAGADCLFTGEAGHHDAIDAVAAGMSLIAAGHFSTEFPVVPVMADRLIKRFPDLEVHVSRKDNDPFSYLP